MRDVLHYRCACCGKPLYGSPRVSCHFCEGMVDFINIYAAELALSSLLSLSGPPGTRKLVIER